MDDTGERLPLPGSRSRAFDVRVLAIAPYRAQAYDEAEWRDTLVVIEAGEIELECVDDDRSRFGPGAVLCLAGLPLRALHNRGPEPALLVAVSRRQASSPAETP